MNQIKKILDKKHINKKILCIGLLVFFGCYFFSYLCFSGNDYWWHVVSGENILNGNFNNGYDTFSWWGSDKLYWVSHSWLTGVIFAALKSIDEKLVYCFILLLDFILISIIIHHNKKIINKNFTFSMFWFILGMFIIKYFTCVRPLMIGFVCITIALIILYKIYETNGKTKLIYFYPILMIAWGNLHGGSSNMGYLLPIIFLIVSCINFKFGLIESKRKNKKTILIYLGLIITSIGALLINPHGLKLLLYPYQNLSDSISMSIIQEWQAPQVGTLNGIICVCVAAVMVILFIQNKKKVRLIDFLLFGMFFYLNLKSLRFSPYVYLFSSVIIGHYIDSFSLFDLNIFKQIKIKENLILLINGFSICILLIGLITGIDNIKFINLADISQIIRSEDDFNEANKNKLFEIIKKDNPSKMFNHYNFGGYLIYNHIPVFFDSRADLFAETILGDGARLSVMAGIDRPLKIQKTINKYQFDAYLTYTDSPLIEFLELKGGVETLYKDDTIIYLKVTDPNSLYGPEDASRPIE